MPSNNTFATFVHFQITFTLACTLLLRMNETLTDEERSNFHIDSDSLSIALLISNVSVLVIGVILIGRACINTSEGDFLDVGFDDHYDEFKEPKKVQRNESKDDNLDIVISRYDTYMSSTKPVLDFYSKNLNFTEIDGSAEIDEITNKIDEILKV